MIDLVWRTTVILGATWVLYRLSPRATPATRHLLWHLAVVVVLAAPVVARMAPTFDTAILPAPAMTAATLGARAAVAPATVRSDDAQWKLAALWAAGSACIALWILYSHLLSARRLKRARPAPAVLQNAVNALAGRWVQVMVGAHDEGPYVRGLFKPSIVLPASAETWDAHRRRAVLLHELAHVRRADCRVQLLAQIACAVYWFNPLMWAAARALRIERERACDDEVILHGATPSAYAADLLDLARAKQMRWASPAVLAMAQPSQLEGRLLAILASDRPRVPARATRFIVVVTICALATATLGARPAPADDAAASRVENRRFTVGQRSQDREETTLRLALDSRADVVPALIAALQDPDAQVREKAALGLGWRSDERVVAPLITALRDDSSQVREKAAIALGSSGNPGALAPLEASLHDPNGEVREKAAAGLTLLRAGGDPEAKGKHVREALSQIVGGLLQLAQ